MKKCTLILILLAAFTFQLYAQEQEPQEQLPQEQQEPQKEKNRWTVVGNVQYVTQHHWRGIGSGALFGEAPAFEPSIAFFNKYWNVGVFAGGSFDGVYKAVMPWVSFSPVKGLWIGVWDIYSPGKEIWQKDPFDFGLTSSKHFVDATISYQLPWLPLSMKWATIVAGQDPNPDGKRNFTSYAEVSYVYNWRALGVYGYVGMTPWSGLYYREKGGVNHLELKLQYKFQLYKPVTLPLFVKFTYNPLAEKFLFVAGASITIPYTFK